MRCMVLVSLQDFNESKLSHHFHKKLSTISRNHGVIIVPSVSLFSEHKTVGNYDNYECIITSEVFHLQSTLCLSKKFTFLFL